MGHLTATTADGVKASGHKIEGRENRGAAGGRGRGMAEGAGAKDCCLESGGLLGSSSSPSPIIVNGDRLRRVFRLWTVLPLSSSRGTLYYIHRFWEKEKALRKKKEKKNKFLIHFSFFTFSCIFYGGRNHLYSTYFLSIHILNFKKIIKLR